MNTLRLWKAARSTRSASTPSTPATTSAPRRAATAPSALRVLYPDDTTPAGQELRLRQEYFFILGLAAGHPARRHLQQYGRLDNLPDKVAIQLNDTHPALASPS